MVHLLHELLRIQSDIAGARRHFDYTIRQSGYNPHCPSLSTPVALDAAARSIEMAIEQTGVFLKGQVIGLYSADAALEAARDCPPPPVGR